MELSAGCGTGNLECDHNTQSQIAFFDSDNRRSTRIGNRVYCSASRSLYEFNGDSRGEIMSPVPRHTCSSPAELRDAALLLRSSPGKHMRLSSCHSHHVEWLSSFSGVEAEVGKRKECSRQNADNRASRLWVALMK